MPKETLTRFFQLNEEGTLFRRDNDLAVTFYKFPGDLDIAMGDEMKTAGITLERLRQFTKDVDRDSAQAIESLRTDLKSAMGAVAIKSLRTYDVLFSQFMVLRQLGRVLEERLTDEEKRVIDVRKVFGAIRIPGLELLFCKPVEGIRLSEIEFSSSEHPDLVRILGIKNDDFQYASYTLRSIAGKNIAGMIPFLSRGVVFCRENDGQKRYTITGV